MKFSGKIGFEIMEENPPESGIWKPTIVERTYRGDILDFTIRGEQDTQTPNGKISVTNQISILGDFFAYKNFQRIRYVKFMGIACEIPTTKVQYPRIILTLGGEYNGEQT